MTTVEAEVLDEFDLDIQVDETDPHSRRYDPRDMTYTGTMCSCSWCCKTCFCHTARAVCGVRQLPHRL